jgi:multiple sugar transport system permease protein
VKLTRRQRVILITPLSLVLALGLVGPAALGLVATFTTYAPGQAAIRLSGLDNYAAVLRDAEFVIAARNIVIFTALAVPLELVIGFSLAWLLRRPVRGRGVLRVLLLVPWLVSPIASGVMWHFLLGTGQGLLQFVTAEFGAVDVPSPLAQRGLALLTTVAVEVWRVAPLAAFLLLPGLTAIAPEKWEHATVEGASSIVQVRHVALPEIRPLALAVTMLLVGGAIGTFDAVLILTGGGPGSETTTPALFSYNAAFGASDWPVGTASAWLIAAALFVIGAVYVRLARSGAA